MIRRPPRSTRTDTLFPDTTSSDLLSMRVLLFHQSLQTSHPAFPAVMRGGEIYMQFVNGNRTIRSEEHTSELQSLMRISYDVFCLKKKKKKRSQTYHKLA